MPSTYTPQNRLELQNPGENLNTWGGKLNADTIALVDFAIAGASAVTVSGPVTLTTVNGSADQARSAILVLTGTGGTVTIPGASHVYQVVNNCSGDVVFTTGGGVTATVEPGSSATAVCQNGVDCLRFVDAADIAACLVSAKAYTDAAAFSAAGGNLPGQTGNAGKFLSTDGTNPFWTQLTSISITTALGYTPQVALGYTPLNPANNLLDLADRSAALTNLNAVSRTFLAANYTLTSVIVATYAPLVSPALSGIPTVPTAAANTNTTQAASTAMVQAAIAASASPTSTYAQFQEQQTSGTAGTSLPSGSWTKRTLNTTITNTIAGCSIASSQITLPAGTYSITAMGGVNITVAPGQARHRIRNTTNSTNTVLGPGISVATGTTGNATLQRIFILLTTSVFEFDTFVNAGTGTTGAAVSTGDVEVYSDVLIQKLA